MRATEFVTEAQRWPDIESAKRAFVSNPRFQHLPVSTRQAMAASAYQKQRAPTKDLSAKLKQPATPHWQDLDESYYRVPGNIFPDGDLYLTSHALHTRFPERNIPIDRVIDLCQQAGEQFPNKLENLGDASLVIQAPDQFGVALLKQEMSDGTCRYLVKTAHDRLKCSQEQTVIRVR